MNQSNYSKTVLEKSEKKINLQLATIKMLDRTKGLGYTTFCSAYSNRQLKIDMLPRKERGSLVKLLQ